MSDSGFDVGKVLGWLLLVFSGLWLVFSGGCTLVFLVMTFAPQGLPGPAPSDLSMLPVVLFCGAIGIVPGALVFWAGWTLVRRRPPTAAT